MSRAQEMVDSAMVRLGDAKNVFSRALAAVDSQLQHAVGLDPAVLERAQAVQENYRVSYLPRTIHPADQPAGAPEQDVTDEPVDPPVPPVEVPASVVEPPMVEDGE